DRLHAARADAGEHGSLRARGAAVAARRVGRRGLGQPLVARAPARRHPRAGGGRGGGAPMRHPVSTIARSGGGERLRGAMSADVVWGAVLPAAPENAGPRASEDPDRVLMATPTRTRALIHEGRPPRGVAGIIGEGRDGTAQALVARPAKHD